MNLEATKHNLLMMIHELNEYRGDWRENRKINGTFYELETLISNLYKSYDIMGRVAKDYEEDWKRKEEVYAKRNHQANDAIAGA